MDEDVTGHVNAIAARSLCSEEPKEQSKRV